jgi:NAD(P)-dependent dehydrogenase (short-subunit alcohol dehydrogenase family)
MSHNPSSAQQSASVIIGASGGIGDALVRRYLALGDCETVFAVSRTSQTSSVALSGTRLRWLLCDSSGEDVKRVVEELVSSGLNLRRIIICTGLLHNEDITPEKSLDKLDPDAMRAVFDVNLVIPALWLAALVKPLRRTEGSVIAVLSARVGSIADNRLGGWYSYRASKAALNMFLKSAAIEYSRRSPGVKLVSFHPARLTRIYRLHFRPMSAKKRYLHLILSPIVLLSCLTKYSQMGSCRSWTGQASKYPGSLSALGCELAIAVRS